MKRSVCSCTDYTCTCGRTDGPGEKKGRRAPFVDRTNATPQPPQAGRYTGWTVPVYTHPSLRHLLKHRPLPDASSPQNVPPPPALPVGRLPQFIPQIASTTQISVADRQHDPMQEDEPPKQTTIKYAKIAVQPW